MGGLEAFPFDLPQNLSFAVNSKEPLSNFDQQLDMATANQHSDNLGSESELSTPPNLSFRTETRTDYICTYHNCNKRFGRIYDLRRHHRTTHDNKVKYYCQYQACPRKIRPFPRKDKRDEHERKVHKKTGQLEEQKMGFGFENMTYEGLFG